MLEIILVSETSVMPSLAYSLRSKNGNCNRLEAAEFCNVVQRFVKLTDADLLSSPCRLANGHLMVVVEIVPCKDQTVRELDRFCTDMFSRACDEIRDELKELE